MIRRTRPAQADPDDHYLTRRYLAALALVALLILVDQALVQPPLHELATDAPVINMSGRQRMLGQRLAKAALALERAATRDDRDRFRSELDVVLIRWAASHDGLRFGNEALSLPGKNSAAVRAAMDDIEPYFRRIRDAVARLAAGEGGPAAARDDLAVIMDLEVGYLLRMDNIVQLYEAEARARVAGLRRTGWALAGLALLALVGIGLFILRPAARLIRRQFAELRRARDALEVRVRERTAELERANRDLQHEVGERALAEARHRALVEQLGHVARTTTIGEMATGLAHELNQPLGAAANYVEGCLVALESPGPPLDEVRGALGKALAAILRAGLIIRRIRRFVTRHPAEPELFAPNRVVEEVEAFFRDEARRLGIAIRLDMAPELPFLSGDPVQIQQVLVNLVRNATEAVSGPETPSPTVVMETDSAPAGAVEFRVTDNGEGISPDHALRVFDPFFSTRAEGMGMGLTISRTIVEAHLGRISVDSEPGVRTTFRFTIPPPAGAEDHGSDRLRRG